MCQCDKTTRLNFKMIMKLKVFSTVLFLLVQFGIYAHTKAVNDSTVQAGLEEVYDLDSMLDNLADDSVHKAALIGDTVKTKYKFTEPELAPVEKADTSLQFYDIYRMISDNNLKVDTLLLQANPLFIDLVYKEIKNSLNIKENLFPYTYFFGVKPLTMVQRIYKPIEVPAAEKIINDLRFATTRDFALNSPKLFAFKFEKLPGTQEVKSQMINGHVLDKVQFVDKKQISARDNKLVVKKIEVSPWTSKANILTQFSQNIVSDNWYQGGNSNMAVLGVLSGQMNYDNKKNVQFENNAEWRMGFYFVDDSTALRKINTNNDILKINSKLGYKINGNWFYSGSIEFSTQFLNNYKAVNSDVLKASFLTPVRLNVGVGLDYKYKKMFSLALSPVSYKYIYIHETDENVVNPNLFGIEKGKNELREIGSSFKAQLAYSPVREIQIDSKLSFYTNYEKVEIDWEIIGNFTINRYLSTRLSLNPRYDNTVILAAGEKAKLQFKELLSFGFSYKLLN